MSINRHFPRTCNLLRYVLKYECMHFIWSKQRIIAADVTLSPTVAIVISESLKCTRRIKMKRSILITLAVAAVLSCTACGKVGKDEGAAVPAAAGNNFTEAATIAEETEEKTTEQPTEAAEETSAEAVETTAEETTADVTEAAAVENEVPQRPSADTAPSHDDPYYAPAPAKHDIEGITYIQGALIANKSYSLPADFNPGLDPTCETQFNKMINDAARQGLNIWFASGFRSYDYQAQIYSNYVARDGQALADTYSARPGYSEHQSGLAIDVNSIDDSFAGTPEAVWLENHCHEYGFILRYPRGKENITGYQYESWHVRYLGTDLSYAVHNSGLTLEEYFGIDSYYHE